MKFFHRRRPKVFVIGRNKTGTTSMVDVLSKAGFVVGDQNTAEALSEDWAKRDFRKIIRFCNTADAFQDSPFSLPYTYQAVDQAFSGSKFILTVRDSGDQWFESVTRFHTKLIGRSRLPTAQDLQQFPYIYKGWLWRQQQIIYGVDENTLYDRDIYIAHYEKHNADVQEYFRFRINDLLVLNLADTEARKKLALFLGVSEGVIHIPHLNKSSE